MNRRDFFRRTIGGIVAATVAPYLPIAPVATIATPVSTITCSEVFGVDFQWEDIEHALKLERCDERIRHFYANDLEARAMTLAYPPRFYFNE